MFSLPTDGGLRCPSFHTLLGHHRPGQLILLGSFIFHDCHHASISEGDLWLVSVSFG